MTKVSLSSIESVTREVLSACGVSNNSIDIILETIYYANRCGIPTHGIGRLPLYVKKIKSGNFNPKDEVITVVDSDAIAVLDANNGFGQVAAQHAIDVALEKAKKYGVAVVGVRNSNNFATAGYFGDYVARRGMAALIFANASPAIAPTGGTKKIFGTNPMCFAFPGSDNNNPIVLDMATSVVARGKVRLAAKNGEKIPFDWAVGPDGKATDDPSVALMGSLLPIAGYKGYGLSLFVDLLAGFLTGSAYGGEVKPLSDMNNASKNGHFFVLIDTKRFMNETELKQKVDVFYQSVKSCGDDDVVMLPGEPGYRRMVTNEDSVEISNKQLEDVNEIASELNTKSRLEEVV